MNYAIAKLDITDPEKLAAYRDVAGTALAKHGGAVVTASGVYTVLDGAPDTTGVTAILSFPDKASALAWANDPELADVHALRRSAGASNIQFLG